MSLFEPHFDRPGPGPENEPPRSPFYLFFRYLSTYFFKLVQLNLLFFFVTLPVYVWFTTLLNLVSVENGAGIPGMLAAVLIYCMDRVPPAVGVVLFLISAFLWGPACAGLTYVTMLYSAGQHAWVFADFRKAAVENWKQAVPMGFVDILAAYATMNYLFSPDFLQMAGGAPARLFWFLLLAAYLCCRVFLYPLMIQVDAPVAILIKDAFILGAVSLWRVFAVLAAAAALALLSCYFDFILLPLFSYAFLSFFACALLQPVIHRYLD